MIVEYLRSKGLEVKDRGKDVVLRCIWHKEKVASLYIEKGSGVFHCFGCGEKGRFERIVMQLEGCSYEEAKRIAVKVLGLGKNSVGVSELSKGSRDYVVEDVLLEKMVDFLPGVALSRGITLETLRRYEVRVLGNYMWFPVWDRGRRFVGFVRRSLSGGKVYLNDFKVSEYLYPEWLWDGREEVFLVEGIFDCMRLMQDCGGVFGFAVFGSVVSKRQALKLVDFGVKRVYMMFDSDVSLSKLKKSEEVLSFLGLDVSIVDLKAFGDKVDVCDLSVSDLRGVVFGVLEGRDEKGS